MQKLEGCDAALIGYADDPLTDQLRPAYSRELLLGLLTRRRLAELLTRDVPQDLVGKREEAAAWAAERLLEVVTQYTGPGMPLVIHSAATTSLFDTIVARSTPGDSHTAQTTTPGGRRERFHHPAPGAGRDHRGARPAVDPGGPGEEPGRPPD